VQSASFCPFGITISEKSALPSAAAFI
jgi:hypothetical protein